MAAEVQLVSRGLRFSLVQYTSGLGALVLSRESAEFVGGIDASPPSKPPSSSSSSQPTSFSRSPAYV
jgi:hypothetical protein